MEKSIYNDAFYDLQSKESYESALVVLALLRKKLGAKIKLDSIIDFGCGVGSWLAAAKEVGFKHVCGTDGDYVPKSRLMINEEDFLNNNLSDTESIKLPEDKFDLAITLEVAEHLPESSSTDFVEKIVQTSNLVLFSAAIPYQGGHGHVNENWLSYWSLKFRQAGYTCIDLIRPEVWTDNRVCWWYRQNIVLFVKNNTIQNLPVGTSLNTPLDIVHPEQFLVSLHRERTNRFYSLQEDTSHFQNSSNFKLNRPLSYGSEYSYQEDKEVKIENLAELQRIAEEQNNPVLKDAIAPVVTREFDIDSFAEKALGVKSRPDFLCVGAQKSATTWLYEVLRQQDTVWLPPIKELNFFNQLVFDESSAYSGVWRRRGALKKLHQASRNEEVNHNWLRFLFHLCEPETDVNWYSEIFNRCPPHMLSGEITPEYMMLPHTGIKAVRALNPDLKIIMILREPIARINSHLKMIKVNCPNISADLLDELARMESIVNRSDYETLINNWLKVFDREQLFIGNYSELKKSPEAFLNKLSGFLDVDLNPNNGVLKKIIHGSQHDDTFYVKSLYDVNSLNYYLEYWKEIRFN